MCLLLLVTTSISAQNIDDFFKISDDFFKTHVKDGKIDYKAIKKNTDPLGLILEQVKSIRVDIADEQNYKAFWINTYNILVIKGIVNQFPVASPLDIDGFFDKNKFDAGGMSVTLNEIENKLLRSEFKDPRLHFVLVCGAVGCPPLISNVYKPNTLEQQLTTQTKKAINSNFIKINYKKKRVQVSQIMEWYKEDFILNGNEIDFINKYLEEPISKKYKLSYFKYNWQLNIQP
ncbi:hypothetical protein FBALC1_10322 [Flavobacteriales bacterium ALC-1]|nr:hypothetical protein FBALC1_10322 [Flavobacteriales bacterium ALC-1]